MALGLIPSIAPQVALGRPTGATNLISNGGFETNATGWGAGGTNTAVRSTEQAKFGAASLKCTFQDTAVLVAFAGLTLTAVPHSGSVWVYIPTDYDGQQVGARFDAYVGMAGTLTTDANMLLRDQWQQMRIPNVTPAAGDLLGSFQLRTTGAGPTAGRFVYIDGAQVEANAFVTPYIETDGGTASRNPLKWVA